MDLRDELGDIDIYLLDQLLKGRVRPGMKILDAGCGGGRNLRYFLKNGYDVYGADDNADSIEALRTSAFELSTKARAENFRIESLDKMSYAAAQFDFVICNAVLHFARNDAQFDGMLSELWRVLKPGGILFARLASSIGIERHVKQIQGRRYHLPDGSDRFLVDEALLLKWTRHLGAEQLEPIKTVNVQNLRCMTTWVLRKP